MEKHEEGGNLDPFHSGQTGPRSGVSLTERLFLEETTFLKL